MKTKIGILGTGHRAVRLAQLFAESGREVIPGARTPERAGRIAAELGQRQGCFPQLNWRLLGEPWTMGKAERVNQLIVWNQAMRSGSLIVSRIQAGRKSHSRPVSQCAKLLR